MKKRWWIIALLIALPVIVIGLNGGCASSTLPPRLSKSQIEAIATTRFQATVGVEEFKHPVYSEKLLKALRETGLFEKVESLRSFKEPPTFIARVERTIYGTATIPLLTIISFGIIPTTVEEEHGHSFSLTPSAMPDKRIAVEFRYAGPTTLGWWAVLLNLSLNRTSADVYGHPRFRQGLAWEIVSHETELKRFSISGPSP